MGSAFDDIIEGTTADVEVAPKGANDFDSLQDVRAMPASLVTKLEALPEVEQAYAQDTLQTVFVIGRNGKVVGGNGPPGLAFNYTGVQNLAGDPVLTLADGKTPDRSGEIALDERTAEKADYQIGDTVKLVTPGDPPSMTAKLVGIVDFGAGGTNGATITIFDKKEIQDRFFGGKDVYTGISLSAAEGVSQQQLADAAQKVLPRGVEARP